MESRPQGPLPLATTDPVGEALDPRRGFPGQLLAGKYLLEHEIGRGGMGVVWLAQRCDWAGARVAVKLMHRVDTPLARERFTREVNLMAMLRSPYVVQVLDHGVDETGALFIVMEHLEGENLGTRLGRLQVLSPGEVMLLVTHLGRALSRARVAGVVHRDLKPDNIFLVHNHNDPIVKVLDFGLAKPFESMIDSRAVTVPGNAVGTPWYMSTEQIKGATPNHTGNLWSLAVIACECLIGKRPFDAPDLPTLTLRLWKEERPVPSRLGVVPAGFDEWFAKATHRDVDQRFQTAEELVEALAGVCDSSRSDMPPVYSQRRAPSARSSSLDPVTRPPEPWTFFSRRSTIAIGLIAGAIIGIGGNAYFFLRQMPTAAPVPSVHSESTPPPSSAAAPALTAPATAPLESPTSAPPVAAMPAVDRTVSPPDSSSSLPSASVAPALNPAPAPDTARHGRDKPRVSPNSHPRGAASSRGPRPATRAYSPNEPLNTEL